MLAIVATSLGVFHFNSIRSSLMREFSSFPRLERTPLAEVANRDTEAVAPQQAVRNASVVWLMTRYLWGVLVNLLEASRRWQRDDAGLLAACVAYYATISLFPLLMVLIAGLGIFLRFTSIGQSSEEFVLTVIAQETTQDVAMQVNAAFQQIEHSALSSGPLAMVGLVAAALAVFAQFDKAFDKIWKIDAPAFDGYVSAARRAVIHRVKAFLVLFSLGGVVAMIFFASLALNAVISYSNEWLPISEALWRIVEAIVSVLIDTIIFTAIYKCLSKIPVGWMHAARGGLLAALTWEVGRLLLAAYLSVSNYSAYGVVGSLLVAMLWSYYASSILFLGAEYVQVIREQSLRKQREAMLEQALELHRELIGVRSTPLSRHLLRRPKLPIRRVA